MGKSLLVAEKLLEKVPITRFFDYRAHESDLFVPGLGGQGYHAPLDQTNTVKVTVDHGKGVVSELSLVHQVSHQSKHHVYLSFHVLDRALVLFLLLLHLFDLIKQLKALFKS